MKMGEDQQVIQIINTVDLQIFSTMDKIGSAVNSDVSNAKMSI